MLQEESTPGQGEVAFDWRAVLARSEPRVVAVARLGAPPEAVFAVVGDHTALPRYLFGLLSVTVDDRGAAEPGGPGAVRVIRALGTVTRERVYAREPPHHLSYGLIGDRLVRNHVASIRLEPEGGGTRLTIRQFYEPLPGLRGRATAAAIRFAARRMARRLAAIFGGRMEHS